MIDRPCPAIYYDAEPDNQLEELIATRDKWNREKAGKPKLAGKYLLNDPKIGTGKTVKKMAEMTPAEIQAMTPKQNAIMRRQYIYSIWLADYFLDPFEVDITDCWRGDITDPDEKELIKWLDHNVSYEPVIAEIHEMERQKSWYWYSNTDRVKNMGWIYDDKLGQGQTVKKLDSMTLEERQALTDEQLKIIARQFLYIGWVNEIESYKYILDHHPRAWRECLTQEENKVLTGLDKLGHPDILIKEITDMEQLESWYW